MPQQQVQQGSAPIEKVERMNMSELLKVDLNFSFSFHFSFIFSFLFSIYFLFLELGLG